MNIHQNIKYWLTRVNFESQWKLKQILITCRNVSKIYEVHRRVTKQLRMCWDNVSVCVLQSTILIEGTVYVQLIVKPTDAHAHLLLLRTSMCASRMTKCQPPESTFPLRDVITFHLIAFRAHQVCPLSGVLMDHFTSYQYVQITHKTEEMSLPLTLCRAFIVRVWQMVWGDARCCVELVRLS